MSSVGDAAGEPGAGEDREPDRGRAARARRGAPGAPPGTAASAITRLKETSTQVTAGDAGVELAVDLRQRQDDDRGVGEDEADGERQRGDARSRSVALSSPAPCAYLSR